MIISVLILTRYKVLLVLLRDQPVVELVFSMLDESRRLSTVHALEQMVLKLSSTPCMSVRGSRVLRFRVYFFRVLTLMEKTPRFDLFFLPLLPLSWNTNTNLFPRNYSVIMFVKQGPSVQSVSAWHSHDCHGVCRVSVCSWA